MHTGESYERDTPFNLGLHQEIEVYAFPVNMECEGPVIEATYVALLRLRWIYLNLHQLFSLQRTEEVPVGVQGLGRGTGSSLFCLLFHPPRSSCGPFRLPPPAPLSPEMISCRPAASCLHLLLLLSPYSHCNVPFGKRGERRCLGKGSGCPSV